jgi:muramoyltetrapeptide carboxypeptidase LdcA involved in peptidoglycan recycling
LDATQVLSGSSTETGTAVASFYLDSAQQNLSYTIQIFGLDLKADPADRTGFSDVTAIHLHNGFFDTSGPHVLNIFGVPSEDDAELVVDFANDTISGVFNDADAIDPNTGSLFDQNNPMTTKLLSNFTDDLVGAQLYLAIHTAGQNGNIAVRGQLLAVPEPSSLAIIAVGSICVFVRRRR